ncbi:MAG: hypothetical protein H6Q03_2066 [Acidobacteria bacterium]|nr:hypothetical protein [Acidobacteriota bacterium]
MAKARLPVLPSDPPARTIRKSRTSKWRAASLVAVHLIVAAHVAHWLVAGRTVTPVEPSEAMAFAKGGVINAGLIFFAATILLTALFGRFFCGWACHLVALQDLSRWLLEKAGIRPRPLRSRLLAWVPTVAFFYMFLWPALWRLWAGDDPTRVHGTELTTSAFWETFPGWVVAILTLLVCGFLCVYFLGAKGFCTYACPYGAAFAAAERLAPLRVRVTDACNGCGHCTAVCTSNVRVHEEVRDYGMVVDPGCMKCADCVSVCPNDALYLGLGRLPLAAGRRTAPAAPRRAALSRGEEIVLGLAFVAGLAAWRGLYGEIPFLMSLGLAGVLAFLALLALRLARRRDLAWRRWRFKRAGALLPAGHVLVALLAAVGTAWIYAGVLRAEAALADRVYRGTAPQRSALVDATAAPPALDAAVRRRIEGALGRYERIERWGLFPWLGAPGRRAALAYLAGDAATFSAAARTAFERGEATFELALLSARAAAERGDLGAARAAGEAAIGLALDRPEGYAALAVLLARGGALDAAAEVLGRGLARLPASTRLAYDAGVVAAMRGRPGEAIGAFARVLELDPGHRMARENLAGMLAAAGRFEESVSLYRAALREAPGDLDLRLLLARALAGAGRPDEARTEVARVLAGSPGHPAAEALRSELAAASPPASPAR